MDEYIEHMSAVNPSIQLGSIALTSPVKIRFLFVTDSEFA